MIHPLLINKTATLAKFLWEGYRSTWEPIAGAGLEYRVSKHVGVNGQYKVVMNVNNEFGTVNMGLFGVNFYF